MDHTLERQARRPLGLALGGSRIGSPEQVTDSSFEHGGTGTSIGWADPGTGLAMAYIINGFRAAQSNIQRLSSISQAVRDACL